MTHTRYDFFFLDDGVYYILTCVTTNKHREKISLPGMRGGGRNMSLRYRLNQGLFFFFFYDGQAWCFRDCSRSRGRIKTALWPSFGLRPTSRETLVQEENNMSEWRTLCLAARREKSAEAAALVCVFTSPVATCQTAPENKRSEQTLWKTSRSEILHQKFASRCERRGEDSLNWQRGLFYLLQV